jgi:hypothetical protein
MKKFTKKLAIMLLMLVLVCCCFTGCVKPYDTPEFVTIEASQTAFLIPLIGDTTNQASFESEELLLEAKVATKEIQIPHRWVQTGRMRWMGEYRASATLIVVERKPVSRSWESGDSTASSSNRAIFGGSSDNIGIYVGMNCTAMIEEKDAAKFLYRYNNTPLETIIDTDIKKMVEDRFNVETAKYTSTELGAKKGEIMEAVKAYVVDYFKAYGITITVLGLKEDISYENPEIQKAIDAKFASEKELVIQQNKNEASIAKAEAEAQAVKIAAQAEADAMKILADAQAEANRTLAESLTDEILKQMYYERWDGKLPEVMLGEDANTIIDIG